jgi:N4-(beta-N-acetylglucosaminyl)-L-asparaginase
MKFSRRDFLASAALTSASLAAGIKAESQTTTVHDHHPAKTMSMAPNPAAGRRPVIISKNTGIQSIDQAYQMLRGGADTLDAVTLVCKTQEDDPNDISVGLGGLPNEDGEVELDCSCMHGPTRRAGAVGGVRNIKNVSLLARAVMDHTGHVMLVGEGAQRFAVARGFPKENLLTDRSRKIWLLWKETMSDQDWWGPGLSDPSWKPPVVPHTAPTSENFQQRLRKMDQIAADLGIEPQYRQDAIRHVLFPSGGTIHCSAVNEKGEMSGMTTTSGLEWKIPGRLGDSPIIGAGCYTDQQVGSAGATGSGEENIRVAGAHTIVENMRRGMSPQEAGLDALRRVAALYNNNMAKIRFLQMVYYILRNDGAYAGVALWSQSAAGRPAQFAVHDGSKRLENCVPLFQGTPVEWPPIPTLPPNS